MPPTTKKITAHPTPAGPFFPSIHTRAEYTQMLTIPALPSNAASDWIECVTEHRELAVKLAAHEAMAPNLMQTYDTPANSKNNVYFCWDFCTRTLAMLQTNVDPELKEGFKSMADCFMRGMMLRELILDTKPGMLDQMTESVYKDQKGKHPAFGEEILDLCRRQNEKED